MKPFPTQLLPRRLQAIVRAVSASFGIPDVVAAASALAVTSASLGKGLRIQSGSGRHLRGNLYLLISADSGTSKTSALQEMVAPLREIEDYAREFPQFFGLKPRGLTKDSDEELEIFGVPVSSGPPQLREKPSRPNRPKEQKLPQLIAEDVTGPALATLLAENGEVTFLVSDEAGNLMDAAGQKSSELGRILLKASTGSPIDVERLSRQSVRLGEPFISVLWMCQPHRLNRFLAREHLLEDGIIARFLVAHSDARMTPYSESAIPVTVRDEYGALISDLIGSYYESPANLKTVATTSESFDVLKAFHAKAVRSWEEADSGLRACIARWTELAWKVSLVLHAAEHGGEAHKHPLSVSTAENATALVEWFSGQQMSILKVSPGDRIDTLCERLFDLLEKSPDSAVTIRDLKNGHGFDDEGIVKILSLHGQRLERSKLQNPRGGRPSEIISLRQTEGD